MRLFMFALLAAGIVLVALLPSRALARSATFAVHPAKHDLCAKTDPTFGGDINYDHSKYHWTCSGPMVIDPESSAGPFTFNLTCSTGKMDPRKRYGVWVSSSSVKIDTKPELNVKGNHFALTVFNKSSGKQKADTWISCTGAGF
jgi:hypothetical protein